MAYKLNPRTGELEDDGTGVPSISPTQLTGAQGNPRAVGEAPPAPLPPVGSIDQASDAPPMAPMPPAAGMLSRELKSTSSTTSYEKTTEREGELAKQRAANVDAQRGAIDQQTDINTRRANVEAEGAQQTAQLAADQEKFAEAQRKLWDAEYARRDAIAQKDMQEARNAKIQDFWADKTTGQKIAAGMAVLFGGLARTKLYAAGNLNARNEGADFIAKAVEDDYKKQQDRIEQLRQNAERSGKNRDTYLEQIDRMEDRMNARFAVATKKLAADVTARLAKVLPDQAAVDGNKAKLALDAIAIDAEQKLEEGKRKKVSATVNRSETLMDPGFAAATRPGMDVNIYGVDGKPIAQVKDPKAATKINEANAAFRQMTGLLKQLENSYDKNGKWIAPWGDEKTVRESLQSQIDVAAKTLYDLGVVAGPDMGIIRGGTGGGAWTGPQAVKNIRTTQAMLAQKQIAALDSQGLPGRQVVGQLLSAPSFGETQPTQQAPVQGGRSGGASSADIAALQRYLQSNPNGPRAGEVRERLRQLGAQ